MIQEFEKYIKNIQKISSEERKNRSKSLEIFNNEGFPNKKLEDWKFTDIKKIILDNFTELKPNENSTSDVKINFIKDFDHNYIVVINGDLRSQNLKYENQNNFTIESFNNEKKQNENLNNSLLHLNNALSRGGYFLKVNSNYKFNKPLIIYNYFTKNMKDKIISNKNFIYLKDNSSLELFDLNFDTSTNSFFQNSLTNIVLKENSCLKNYQIQMNLSKNLNYKYHLVNLATNSNYEKYIFNSGLKLSKLDEEINITGEKVSCAIQSSLFMNKDCHQEIKTKVNHLKPDSKSFQKIKSVLNNNSKTAYQGKIFVKDIAQKTDAYQLSKALILSDDAEFNAKPELEIYADDVKCSHGSTSGNIDDESIYYLMTRGLSKKDAILLLTEAFLFEVTNSIDNQETKKFVERHLKNQIYEYKIH